MQPDIAATAARPQGREYRAHRRRCDRDRQYRLHDADRARRRGIPVVHTVELIDWAHGGPAPEALRNVGANESRTNRIACVECGVDRGRCGFSTVRLRREYGRATNREEDHHGSKKKAKTKKKAKKAAASKKNDEAIRREEEGGAEESGEKEDGTEEEARGEAGAEEACGREARAPKPAAAKPAAPKPAAPKPAPPARAAAPLRRPVRSPIARSARRLPAAARMTTRPKRRRKAARKPAKKRAKAAKTAVKKKAVEDARGQTPRVVARRCAAPQRARAKPSAKAGGKSIKPAAQAEAGRCAAQAGRPRGGGSGCSALPDAVPRPRRSAARRAGASRRGRATPSQPCAPRAFPASRSRRRMGPRYLEVLTPAALRFLATLHRTFESARESAARGARRAAEAL